MKIKTKILKNIISVLCAATISTSSIVTSVGAVSEQKLNEVIKDIDGCNDSISNLNQRKAEINRRKRDKIRNLDNEIQDNENFLNGIVSLIADGENHEAEYNRLTRNLEESRRKRTQINIDCEREVRNIDDLLQQVNTQIYKDYLTNKMLKIEDLN